MVEFEEKDGKALQEAASNVYAEENWRDFPGGFFRELEPLLDPNAVFDVEYAGSLGMRHDYGMYCECSECIGEEPVEDEHDLLEQRIV